MPTYFRNTKYMASKQSSSNRKTFIVCEAALLEHWRRRLTMTRWKCDHKTLDMLSFHLNPIIKPFTSIKETKWKISHQTFYFYFHLFIIISLKQQKIGALFLFVALFWQLPGKICKNWLFQFLSEGNSRMLPARFIVICRYHSFCSIYS